MSFEDRNPATRPSGMSQRSIDRTKRGRFGAVDVGTFAAFCFVVALTSFMLVQGCTPQQRAELKADEAIFAADLETAGTFLAGAAAAAEANPALMAKASVAANAVLKKAGVPPETAAKIAGAINEGNAASLRAAALEVSSVGASLGAGTPPAPSPAAAPTAVPK